MANPSSESKVRPGAGTSAGTSSSASPGASASKASGSNGQTFDGQTMDTWAQIMANLSTQSQRLVRDFLSHNQFPTSSMWDPSGIVRAFAEMSTRLMSDPQALAKAQFNLWQDYLTLWQSATKKMLSGTSEPVIQPKPDDRRFRDAAWHDNQIFDFIKQSYLLTSRWLQTTVRETKGLDEKSAQQVDFYTRQFIDAMAPSNFVLTNPEVLRATIESRGENLIKGLKNLLEDMERGKGKLAIKMTDPDAFQVGGNVATTKGSVIYQNDLMQLLQYDPSTKNVAKRPLLIIPPWINKYYILDLRPENSFIRWAIDQGHTVFVISWVNPDEKLAEKSFADYMLEGPIDAMKVIEAVTQEKSVNVVGYCLGGTLLACLLAYLAAKGESAKIASATFLTSMVDFSEAGELGVFIDEEQLTALENSMNKKGYLDGSAMAGTFNSLRANDLIWSFVINNYLLGKEPFPFDLLYWNSDSTRMPAAMHSFYLRNMYQKNLLRQPGGIELDGIKIDLNKIKTPSFLLSTKEDHIAPWKSCYAATGLYAGPMKFILAASGHIAGVVNPPAANKYCYWSDSKARKSYPGDPESWLAEAETHKGSWWPAWQEWIKAFGNGEIPARKIGGGKYKPIEPAPGAYVRAKAG